MALPTTEMPRYALLKSPLPRTATLLDITRDPPYLDIITRESQAQVDI